MRIFGMGPVELLIIIVIILVIFGPMLIKRFKKSGKELKGAIDETRAAWNESMAGEEEEEPAPKKVKKAKKLPEAEEDVEEYVEDEVPEEEAVPVRKRTRHEEE